MAASSDVDRSSHQPEAILQRFLRQNQPHMSAVDAFFKVLSKETRSTDATCQQLRSCATNGLQALHQLAAGSAQLFQELQSLKDSTISQLEAENLSLRSQVSSLEMSKQVKLSKDIVEPSQFVQAALDNPVFMAKFAEVCVFQVLSEETFLLTSRSIRLQQAGSFSATTSQGSSSGYAGERSPVQHRGRGGIRGRFLGAMQAASGAFGRA